MKFIVDTQLPPKLSLFLKRRGYDCIHTTDTIKGHLLQDPEIIKVAIESDRTVITKDSDFRDNYHFKGAPPKVLYLTFGNIGNKELLEYFDKYLQTIMSHFEEGSDFVEFNREGIFLLE